MRAGPVRRLLLFALAMLTGVAFAVDDLSYVTANKSLEDLPQEMTRYYLQLDARNELPVYWVRDDIGLQMRHIVYALGLLRGSGMTSGVSRELDNILCRLNSHVCSVNTQSNTVWRNQKNSRLCVPAVVWIDALNISHVNEYSTKSLDWLESKFGICSAPGTRDCADAVTEIGRRVDSDGSVDIPVLAQAALKHQGKPVTQCDPGGVTVNVSEQLSNKGYEYVRQLRPAQPISHAINLDKRKMLVAQGYVYKFTQQNFTVNPAIGIDSPLRFDSPPHLSVAHDGETVATGAVTGPANSTLSEETPAVGPLETSGIQDPQRTANAEIATQQPRVAQTLTPPFSEALHDIELDKYFPEQSTDIHSDVMVLDFRVNRCHPLIRYAIANEPCTQAEEPTSYSLLTNPLPPKKHHGTHIAGLVVGNLGLGVRPNAKLDVYDLIREGEADKTTFDYQLEQVISNAINQRRASIRVVNLSVDFNLGRGSGIYKKLEHTFENAGSLLFVTAAGDDPASLDGPCEVVPACLEARAKDNIMVVGGARKSADNMWIIYEHSRYGMRVDIVAPADNVLSASSDSSALVRLSGTSQATAMVSGIAARLFDTPAPQKSDWMPAQVKNRLKATTRLFPTLSGKTSSGVLAADSALDNQQVLIYESDDSDHKLNKVRGQLLELINKDGSRTDGFIPVVAPGLMGTVASFCRMYRYHRAPNGDITFFYEPASEQSLTRWLLMTSYSGAQLLTTTKQLVFKSVDKPNDPIFVPIERVVDFIDKFGGARSCLNPEQS